MISGFQIIGILFGLSLLYFTFLHFKRHEFTRPEAVLWGSLWALMTVTAAFPKTIEGFSEQLGAIRALDLLVALGFILVIGLTFHNYVVVGKLKKKLEHIVADEAMKHPVLTEHQK